jgi:DNA replication factor GINS
MSGQQSGRDAELGITSSLVLKDVYKLLKREIETGSLQQIEPDTFQKLAASLGNLKGQGYEGVEAKVRDRLAELLASSAQLLLEARLHKLMLNKEPPDYSKLTDEEKYALDGMSDSAAKIDEIITATSKGRVKVLESIAVQVRSKQVLVRFLKPIESFVGVDMNKYGPFKQEDVASVPLENARSIVDSGHAVQVRIQP